VQLASIDAQIANTNKSLQAQLTSLSAQEQAAIRDLQYLAASGLEAVRTELGLQMERLRLQEAAAQAALQEVLGDKSFEQFIAEKQAEAAVLLAWIQATLQSYLGAILQSIDPSASIPSAASGMPYVGKDGPVFVHKDEAILTVPQAEQWRSGMSSSGGTTIVFSPQIAITGTTNARKMADEIEDALVEKMQTGSRLRQATKALVEGRG